MAEVPTTQSNSNNNSDLIREFDEIVLEVEGIYLSFGGVKALQNVGFSIYKGEIFSIIGPNGAGKTSMLNVISGFYKASQGTIHFEGVDRTSASPDQVARLGFARTFQNIALFKGMSTLDNIMTGRIVKVKSSFLKEAFYYPAREQEVEQRAYVEEIIDFLEIQSIRKIPVGKLAYGLQKRVELGRKCSFWIFIVAVEYSRALVNNFT